MPVRIRIEDEATGSVLGSYTGIPDVFAGRVLGMLRQVVALAQHAAQLKNGLAGIGAALELGPGPVAPRARARGRGRG